MANASTKTKPGFYILLIITLLSVAAAAYLLTDVCTHTQPEFQIPRIEYDFVEGVPFFDEENSYAQIYQDGMAFSTHICGEITIENNEAKLYFTNDKENDVLLRLEITDAEGNLYAETGTIKPGTYMPVVTFQKIPEFGTELIMRIISYEQDTYYSAGAVKLITTYQETY